MCVYIYIYILHIIIISICMCIHIYTYTMLIDTAARVSADQSVPSNRTAIDNSQVPHSIYFVTWRFPTHVYIYIYRERERESEITTQHSPDFCCTHQAAFSWLKWSRPFRAHVATSP